MKLVTFDAENMVSQRKGDAYISFSRNAANSLSKAAVDRTGFSPEDKIAIHQDEDNPEDWYLSLGEAGFPLRDDKKDGSSLYFNNTAMSNTILDALGIDEEEQRVSFLISGEPTVVDEVNYWAILTTKPIIKRRKKK